MTILLNAALLLVVIIIALILVWLTWRFIRFHAPIPGPYLFPVDFAFYVIAVVVVVCLIARPDWVGLHPLISKTR